jgi:predicted ferric reductase
MAHSAPTRTTTPIPGARGTPQRRREPATVRQPRRTPAWWRDAAGLAAWMSTLVVVALWVSSRGLQNLATLDMLTSVGRLTGLVSADLLLIQVLLMARIPWLERSYGQDELARRHRLVGFTSFNLMLAHIVLITVGYAVSGHVGLVAQAWELVTTYPGMLLATAAAALLVLVVITSMKAARRRLRYESWHLLHLYAYLGVGLSIPHELWSGIIFAGSPLATAYWWAIYIAAAGSVLVFRLGLPAWRSWRHRLVVHRVVREGRGVVSVYLRGRRLDRLPVSAGQFFIWRFLRGTGWSRGNPYSLSAAPKSKLLRISAKDLGDGSRSLATLSVGTRVLMEGPYGRLTHEVRRGHKLTMIASGIGITPLRALLEDLDYRPGHAVLIYRASDSAGLLFRRELDGLAHQRGVRILYLPGHRVPDRASWLPAHYAVTQDDVALRQFVPDIVEHDVFVCGPQPWTKAVVASARIAGVPEDQIHIELFTW